MLNKFNALSSKQKGNTLIQVLITLFIVSVGLLGFAGLLTKSINDNRQAYMRSQATLLASDLSERVRSNRAGAAAGAYNLANKNSTTTGDLTDWVNQITSTLPAGDATVSTGMNGDNISLTIIIKWTDSEVYEFTTQTII